MKRFTATVLKSKKPSKRLLLTAFILVAGLSLLLFQPISTAKAASIAELQQQAAALEAEIAANNDKLADVKSRRKTLENEVLVFDIEIGSLTTKIEALNKKIKALELRIAEAEEELDYQKSILAESIRTLYKRGGVTTIELLASSDSYSDFISSQEYLSRMKQAIEESAAKVEQLKTELETKHKEQASLLEELDGQRQILGNKRQEKANLLNETRGLESAYQDRTRKLVEQQKAINAEILSRSHVLVGSGPGGYPYYGATCVATGQQSGNCWNYEWILNGSVIDEWGYYYRNCTSYAAWRSALNGKPVPRAMGHGGQWGYNAPAYGLGRGHEPKKGALASYDMGGFGHVAYVEEVLDGGNNVRISEYNFVADGEYSERIIPASWATWYVYP